MSGPHKTALGLTSEESIDEYSAESTEESIEESIAESTAARDEHELSLRDGRRLTVSEVGRDQLVEIRGESGMLEVRIRLTVDGPVLQMESARLELRASEAVQIESPRVEINGTERLELNGGQVAVHGEEEVQIDANGDVRVVGKMIYLN